MRTAKYSYADVEISSLHMNKIRDNDSPNHILLDEREYIIN